MHRFNRRWTRSKLAIVQSMVMALANGTLATILDQSRRASGFSLISFVATSFHQLSLLAAPARARCGCCNSYRLPRDGRSVGNISFVVVVSCWLVWKMTTLSCNAVLMLCFG